MKYISIFALFVLGLIFCLSYSSNDFKENFDTNNCPNLLIQKGSEIHLVNTNKATVPGVNPVKFKNLEEYVEYMEWMQANNIKCPVLYLQQTYNTQGERGYRILPDPLDPQAGLPSNVTNGIAIEPVSKLLNADRDDPPLNSNNYPGFDSQNQYNGLFTPIDQIECTEQDGVDNPMCGNWNAKKALKNLAQGKYLERSRPDANTNLGNALQNNNFGVNTTTSNNILDNDNTETQPYSRNIQVVNNKSISTKTKNSSNLVKNN